VSPGSHPRRALFGPAGRQDQAHAGRELGARRLDVDFFIGALLGGAGFGIDALTGAMWQLEPAKVERTLTPK